MQCRVVLLREARRREQGSREEIRLRRYYERFGISNEMEGQVEGRAGRFGLITAVGHDVLRTAHSGQGRWAVWWGRFWNQIGTGHLFHHSSVGRFLNRQESSYHISTIAILVR